MKKILNVSIIIKVVIAAHLNSLSQNTTAILYINMVVEKK